MNCTSCEHGPLQRGQGTFEADHEGTKLVITNVPAFICTSCGDEYFEGTIAAELLEEAAQAARLGIQLDERSYVAA